VEQNLATTSPNIAGIYGWLVWASPTCGNAFPALAFFLVGSAPLPTLSWSLNFSFPFGWGTNSNAMKGNKDKRSSGGISHFLFPTYFFRWLVWFLVFDFCNAACTAARIRQKNCMLYLSLCFVWLNGDHWSEFCCCDMDSYFSLSEEYQIIWAMPILKLTI
jgi:hypothetical protein